MKLHWIMFLEQLQNDNNEFNFFYLTESSPPPKKSGGGVVKRMIHFNKDKGDRRRNDIGCGRLSAGIA